MALMLKKIVLKMFIYLIIVEIDTKCIKEIVTLQS
jgi:hypothetical protein